MRRTASDTVSLSVLALDACHTNRSRPAGQNTTRDPPPTLETERGYRTYSRLSN
jgi:hypothetical protein